MDAITAALHLINQEDVLPRWFFVLPPLLLCKAVRLRFSKRWLVGVAMLSCGLSYACLMQQVQLIQLRIEREKVLACDHLIANQSSAACEQALSSFVNDTGRGLAPFTGAVMALLYVALVLSVALIVRRRWFPIIAR